MYAVGCIRNKVSQFAKTLYDSMHGVGTNDLSLIRTVVSRCEVDMVQIKQEFERAYKQPLGKYIAVSACVFYVRHKLPVNNIHFVNRGLLCGPPP